MGVSGEGGVKGGPLEERVAAGSPPRSSAALEKTLVPAAVFAVACENRGASRPCLSRRAGLSSHPERRFSPVFPISGLGFPSLRDCCSQRFLLCARPASLAPCYVGFG